MKPTVGRIVLYTNLGDKDGKYPPEQQAAIITKATPVPPQNADDDVEKSFAVSLHIFYQTGDFHMIDVPYSPNYQRGCWSWPKREE